MAAGHRSLYVCTHDLNCKLGFRSLEDAEKHRRLHEYEDRILRSRLDHAEKLTRRRGRRTASSLVSSSRETGCGGHVGDTAQSPSAQTVQELVDSFSDQQLGATETPKSMHGGIEEQANSTILSPKKVGGSSYGEMLANEEEHMVTYRTSWEYLWGSTSGSFEDYTFVTPILYTYGTIPGHASPAVSCSSSPYKSWRMKIGESDGQWRYMASLPLETPWITIATFCSAVQGMTPKSSLNRILFCS